MRMFWPSQFYWQHSADRGLLFHKRWGRPRQRYNQWRNKAGAMGGMCPPRHVFLGAAFWYFVSHNDTNRTQSREMQGKSRKKYKNVIEIHVTFSSFNKWIYGLFTSWARRCDSRKHSYANDRTLCNVIFCKCKFLLSYPLTANHCISKSVSRCYIIECWAAKVNVYVVFLLSFCIFYML